MARIQTLCILLATLLLATSCTGSWSYYSPEDKQRAKDNGVPYWEDVFQHCFPKNFAGMTLERYLVPKFVMKEFPPDVRYLDTKGEEISGSRTSAPVKFDGYIASIAYIGDATLTEEIPFTIFLIYSRPFMDFFYDPNSIFYVEMGEERFGNAKMRYKAQYDPAEIREKRESTIGEWELRKLQFPSNALGLATSGEYITILCPLNNVDEENASLFESLLAQIDLGCIETQKW